MDLLSKIGYGSVLIIALAISWWSLFTLALSFGMPTLLAIGVSIAFDGAALFFAGMTNKYALADDNGTFPKTATYLMIGLSVVLNVMHAVQLALPMSGIIMFGAASVIAGLIFEVHLRYVHRKTLKEKGRVLDKLPLTGILAFVVHPVVTFRVMNKSIKKRLWTASTTVSDFDETSDIFKKRQKTKVETKPKTIKATATRQDRDNEDKQLETKDAGTKTKDIVLLDKPETNMKDMSVAKIVAYLKDNGIQDRETIRQKVSQIKETDVSKATINKTIGRLEKP